MRKPRPPRSFWFAYLVRATVGRVLPAIFRLRLMGAENLPDGGVVLAGIHVSYADPCLLWCVSPRPTHFMAKIELWDVGILGWGLDHFWAFPVDRDAVDRDALRLAGSFLRACEPVGVFPEGRRRSGGLGEGQGGAAFLAFHNHVPVVPVGIAGTDLILPKGRRVPRLPRIVISIGRPIDPATYAQKSQRERVDAMTQDIMSAIADELEVARSRRQG